MDFIENVPYKVNIIIYIIMYRCTLYPPPTMIIVEHHGVYTMQIKLILKETFFEISHTNILYFT